MTEEEAQKKLCPIMSRSLVGQQMMCKASFCMFWQPYEPPGFAEKADAEFRRSGRQLKSDQGFCSAGARPRVLSWVEVKKGT